MLVAAIGHTEWVQFLRVERMPSPGDILHVEEYWEEPRDLDNNVFHAQKSRMRAGRVRFSFNF